MSREALAEGTVAFDRGLPRAANPFDPSTEAWMCWRDGYEQAGAKARRLVIEAAGKTAHAKTAHGERRPGGTG